MKWLRSQPNQTYHPVILVTGCSSGIGLWLAKMLWEELRFRLVIISRGPSLSKVTKNGIHNTHRCLVRALDVTNPEQRRSLIKEIEETWGGVDILINTAGFAYRAVVEHMDEEAEREQMATNYLGPMALIRLVLPYMRKLGRGNIINVSSVSGMLAMPTMASYSASKHALHGAIESLWYEMKPLGIDVVLVQPGFIRSKSFEKVRFSIRSRSQNNVGKPYEDYYRHIRMPICSII